MPRPGERRRIHVCLLLLSCWLSICPPTTSDVVPATEPNTALTKNAAPVLPEANDKYLYLDAFPAVRDFFPESESDPKHPSFLFGPVNHTAPRVVEFYAPWCGHCREFRDHYIHVAQTAEQMAKDAGLDPTISFHAISCRVHSSLCNQFQIEGFPQIKLFAAGATAPTASVSFIDLHPIDILIQLHVHVDSMPLRPVPNNLHLSNNTQTNNKSKKKLQGATNRSYLQSAKRALASFFQVNTNDSNEDDEQERADVETREATSKTTKATIGRGRSKEQTFANAYYAFDYSLRHGVYPETGIKAVDQPLGPVRKKFLHKWLLLLQKVLPFAWNIHLVIRELLAEFEQATSGLKYLVEILDQFPVPHKWVTCKTTATITTATVVDTKNVCGFWDLFHIMSMGYLEWNLYLPEDRDMRMAILAEDMGRILRDFLNYFFVNVCEVCRQNFVKAYDDCFLGACTRLSHRRLMRFWKEFPLWLWEMHNATNIQAMKVEAERDGRILTVDDERSMQWPRPEDCSKCWTDDGSWDTESVLKYLRIEYWPEDTTTKQYREELGLDNERSAAEIYFNEEAEEGNYDSEDNRDENKLSYYPLVLVWILSLTVVIALLLRRKLERDRAGFHKKN